MVARNPADLTLGPGQTFLRVRSCPKARLTSEYFSEERKKEVEGGEKSRRQKEESPGLTRVA